MYRGYAGQTICVTGAMGRIGQRLLKSLVEMEVNVIAFCKTTPNTFNKEVKWVTGSILCEEDLVKAFEKCNVVIHLAALTNAADSFHDPLAYFENNTLGTIKVLEACRKMNVERMLYASTGHVYGIPQYLPVDEIHPKSPLSPYAASKLAGEIVVENYARSFALNGCVARISNVYGSDMGETIVIGRAIEQVVSGVPINLKNLSPIRDFIHIDDVVQALLRLALVPLISPYTQINICSGKGISILEMAKIVANISVELGIGDGQIVEEIPQFVDVVPEFVMDNSQLIKLTGYIPQTLLAEGIKKDIQILLQRRNLS